MLTAPRPNISVTIDRDDLEILLAGAKLGMQISNQRTWRSLWRKDTVPCLDVKNFDADCCTCTALAAAEEAVA